MATAETTAPKTANGLARQTAPAPVKAVRVVEDNGPLAHLMDTARFEHLQRIALVMATASLIPDHLKGKNDQQTLGNCFLVVNQSLRWGLDPFAVAAETYSVQGKLGFQGKLIAALVNARANLAGKLRYEFTGQGDGRTVTVIGRFQDEENERTVELSVGQAKTSNKMWITDADQKLIYSAATKWARRHCPEVLLGVLTDDDLDRIAESKAITRAPAREVSNLSDLTQSLASPQQVVDAHSSEPTDGPQQTADESQVEAAAAESEQSQDPGEIAVDEEDAMLSLNAKLDQCMNLTSVNETEKAALAAGLNEKQVRDMCNARRDEIRESRGK
jgi:hypothetical protein